MRKGVSVASALVVLVLAGTGAATVARGRRPALEVQRRTETSTGARVRVEVLNASTTRGLARRAMLHLRDSGFDVVQMGNASNTSRDSTLVLDRSGHPEWARRVAEALGGARVETRPDSSRYLDVTVVLGRSWRAPAQPFYP